MRNDIKILRQQLIKRWIEAFDEFEHFKDYEKEVVSVKYAKDVDAYKLQDYKNGEIKSSKKLFNKPPGNSYCEFGLNKNKLPVVAIIFESNTIKWIGFYKWNKDVAEYYEFCYPTKIPSVVESITITYNEKFYQSIRLIGDFPIFSELNMQGIIDRVLEYPYTFLDTKICDYINEKIHKSYGTALFNSNTEYGYEEVYTYNESSLTKIERFTENWPPIIKYIKPSGKSIDKLINDLSNLLANAIIDAFVKEKIGESIFNIQLNYHAIDNYWPYVTIITDEAKEGALAIKTELFFIGGTPIINETLNKNKSVRLKEMFAEFDQYIQSEKAWNKGSELLNKTSKLLTKNRLNDKIKVSQDLIVFATDWSMGYNTEEILLKCGASKKNVKKWKDLNWF